MGRIIRTISEVGYANSQHSNNDGTDGQRLPTTATIIDEKQQQRQHVSHITGGNSQGGGELEQEQEGRFIVGVSGRSGCRHKDSGQIGGRIVVIFILVVFVVFFDVISEQEAGLDADAICTRGRRRESPSHINRKQ